MYTSSSRKPKINLSDYDFSKDLKNRLFLSKLTPLDVEILQEIIYSSLSFPISELIETCEVPREEVEKTLSRLSELDLFTIEEDGNTITVDKDVRKYFEVQIERFDDDFKPDLEFFQGLLAQVPIHVIPTWYSLPKTSDNIFHSIIEKHLSTPKTYEKFLHDLSFDDDHSVNIIQELYASPNFLLDVDTLQSKYSLTGDELEAIIINLEYNKVCCLCYLNEEGCWRRVLSPYDEWRDYLLFLKRTVAKPIEDTENIETQHPRDFGFVEDLDIIVKLMLEHETLLIDSTPEGYAFAQELTAPVDRLSSEPFSRHHEQRLIEKLILLKLASLEEGRLTPTESTAIWLEKPVQEKAMALYFNTINHYRKKDSEDNFSDRDIREVEKSLKRVMHGNWVYADDFIAGMTASIGNSEEVALRKKGRRWGYAIPKYHDSERAFIKEVIQNHLFESGMVSIGQHDGKLCFAVTSFGKLSLGE